MTISLDTGIGGRGKKKKDQERPWPQVKFVPGATVTPDSTFFFFPRIGRRTKMGKEKKQEREGERDVGVSP